MDKQKQPTAKEECKQYPAVVLNATVQTSVPEKPGGGFETTKRLTLTFDSRQTVNSDPDVAVLTSQSLLIECKIRPGLLALTNKIVTKM